MSDSSIRVLQVIAPAPFGGLEEVVRALSVGLHRRGIEVFVAALLDSASPEPRLLQALRDDGVTVFPIVTGSRAYLRQAREIRALYARVGPTVVHSHGYLPDALVLALRLFGGPPVVTTVHGFTGGGRTNRLYEWLQVHSHRKFDGVVAVSTAIADLLKRSGVRSDHLHVVRNAWSSRSALLPANIARERLGVAAKAFSIGWVGRISHEKGLDVLVRAIPMVKAHSADVFVIGDGPERGNIASLAATLGVANRIHWCGPLADAATFMSAFDLYVLSSRTEGTPITLLEAMSARVPIVAAAVGGVPQVVTPMDSLLVPPESPSALAAAIDEVMQDPEMAQQRAARAALRLESEFARDPWLDEYERTYRAVTT